MKAKAVSTVNNKQQSLLRRSEICELVQKHYENSFDECSKGMKDIIENGILKLDLDTVDQQAVLPPCHFVYYPTVSDTIPKDKYNATLKRKLRAEEQKYFQLNQDLLPLLLGYRVDVQNDDVRHQLEDSLFLAMQNRDKDEEDQAFNFLAQVYHFVAHNLPDQSFKEEYKQFWFAILEKLRTDESITHVDEEGVSRPLGVYVSEQIDWLKDNMEEGDSLA